jgi:hypothetical protein
VGYETWLDKNMLWVRVPNSSETGLVVLGDVTRERTSAKHADFDIVLKTALLVVRNQ